MPETNQLPQWNGRALFLRRSAAGLTLKGLSHKANVPLSSISLYERGLRIPSPDNVKRLARALKCTIGDLYREARVS